MEISKRAKAESAHRQEIVDDEIFAARAMARFRCACDFFETGVAWTSCPIHGQRNNAVRHEEVRIKDVWHYLDITERPAHVTKLSKFLDHFVAGILALIGIGALIDMFRQAFRV